MATRVRTYRIDVDANANRGDAIVIGEDGAMTSQHLGTAASLDAGTCCGNVPVIDENGELPNSTIPSNAMKKSVYDPNNKEADAFDYCNLDNTPEIPVVNDPVVTFTQGGITRGSISLNQAGETEIELLAGGLEAGKGIDIYENKIEVDHDACSLFINVDSKLEVTDYANIASGAAAGATAVQPNDLATVAMSGKYCDLTGKPEIPSAQIQSDWNQTNTDLADYIKNKPTIGDAIITIQKNGTNVDCFTLNQTANKCLNIVLDKCDVGLCNVDNTSDADKPVSNATQCALNCKQDNIADLNTIRCNACDGKTASETIACYGDIVTHNVCEFATSTQGGKADTAIQPEDLCSVATSGKYCDLTGTPTIPTDNCQLANSCGYTTCTGTLVVSDLQPYAKSCDLCSVATSGKYCDLTGTPTIPTDNCELGNGCGYITNAVSDLTNYYLKCETYKKCEVDNLIANFGGFEVVSTLPTTNIKTNVIYLLGPIGTGADKYEEWIYYNNTWTKIGETTTDLSNYAKCCDIPTDNCQLSNSCGYTTCTGTLVASDLNPYAKCCDLKTVATSGCYCDLTGLPTIPTDNCQLGNSCGYTTCTGTLVASDLQPYAKSCDLCTVATSGLYCDLTGIPNLCTIATSAKYCDLTGTPSLCNVATSGKYCDLTGTPSLATVATSGCYNDLTGTPTIPTDNCQLGNSCNYITKDVTNLTCYTPTNSLATVATSGAYCDLTGAPTLACVATSGCYDDLSGKPNLGVYQTTANMVCTLADADNSHYPSAKAVSDALSCAGTGDMTSSVYDPCGCCGDAFDYSKLHGAPILCTVATSGKYCDLTGTPTIPAALSAGNGISITSNCINVQYDDSTIKKNSGNCLYVDFPSQVSDAAFSSSWNSVVSIAPSKNAVYDKIASMDTTIAGKMPGFSLNISHATAGNPREVKFLTIDYGNMTQYGAAYFKLSATSCHPDGGGYNYLVDIIIGCTYQGVVRAKILKYVHSSVDQYTPGYAGGGKYFGDVFYVNDTDAKKVYFYILGGQYTSSDFTPATKIGSTSLTNVTQHTGSASYYDGDGTDRVWIEGDSTLYALMTDIPTKVSQLTNDSGYTTCTGTLNSGDLVTVNGCSLVGSGDICIQSGTWGQINGTLCDQTDLQCALDGKLDKVTSTGADRAYIVNSSGEQTTYNVAQGTSNGAIVRRTGTQIVVPDIPTDTCHAASKKYVDDNVIQKSSSAPSNPSEGTVWYDTTNDVLKVYNGTEWIEVGSGGGGTGDMAYADFEWATKTGASISLDLNSTITPAANFTVNVPSEIKEGQAYVLRVNNPSTAYTMTLGSCITNPSGADLTLTPSATDQFIFLATSSTGLELQPEGLMENVFVTQTEYNNLPSSKTTNGRTYFIYES